MKKENLEKIYTEMVASGEIDMYPSTRGYHTTTNPYLQEYATDEAHKRTTPTYGLEIETYNTSDGERENMARFIQGYLTWNCQRDSSVHYGVDSCEIITQPKTMARWLEDQDQIKQLFKLLSISGFEINDSCGLHIHVNNKALGEEQKDIEMVQLKMDLILENYKKEFTTFSRRSGDSINHYTGFVSAKANSKKKTFFDIINIKKYKSGRYYAINTENTKTTEIRLFASTLDPDVLYACIQMVDNLVHIAKNEDLTKISFDDIVNYNVNYKELISYCNKNKIHNKRKIIDKTYIEQIKALRNDKKILKDNAEYNEMRNNIAIILSENISLMERIKEQYDTLYVVKSNFNYIVSDNFLDNTLYRKLKQFNNALSNYKLETLTNGKQKRVFFNNDTKKETIKLYREILKDIKEMEGN